MIPQAIPQDETAPTVVTAYETIDQMAARMDQRHLGALRPLNRREGRVLRVGLALGIFLGLAGCQATVPPAPTETVGQLADGPSVYSAPVHEATPPPSETYAVRARRERQAEQAKAVDAPQVEEKVSHGF